MSLRTHLYAAALGALLLAGIQTQTFDKQALVDHMIEAEYDRVYVIAEAFARDIEGPEIPIPKRKPENRGYSLAFRQSMDALFASLIPEAKAGTE